MTIAKSPFARPGASPFYAAYGLYLVSVGPPRQWEFNGWKPESMSWKTGCYIHAGLSGPGQFVYRGTEAEKFLSSICVNNFSNFAVGAAKHSIMCNDDGLIAGHGLMQRMAPEEFRLFVSGPWSRYIHSKGGFDVEETVEDNFLFQVAGPTSIDSLEAATGETLRDVSFLRYRNTTVAGKKVQIMRIGMAGTLAYELHGPIEDGAAVYDAVVNAGKPFNLERLGWQTYTVNHVEGGFPQQAWTFLAASNADSGFRKFVNKMGAIRFAPPLFTGSVDPSNARARFRTPTEVGWEKSVRFDHEFMGRKALEKEHASPKRTIVTLVWNSKDVIDIYASLFEQGEDYKYIELPSSPHLRGVLAHADHVLKDGETVGVSSGTVYSYYFRQMISLCTIDLGAAKIGTEVVLQWGDFGKKLKEVRATVARFPYLNADRNQTVNVAKVS